MRVPVVTMAMFLYKDKLACATRLSGCYQSSLDHFCVIDDKHIARLEIVDDIWVFSIRNSAGMAVKNQQPCITTHCRWRGRNQFFGNIIVKISELHHLLV